VDERWSFLAYALSSHPFSCELSRLKAGRTLRMALNLIDRRVAKLQNLSYSDLDRVLPYLDSIEREQYVDYIVRRYAWVDFSLSISQFGSKEALVVATDSTSGGEYDFNEEYSRDSDEEYLKLVQFINTKGVLREVYSGALSDRTDMAVEAARKCGASLHQLKKFFHIT